MSSFIMGDIKKRGSDVVQTLLIEKKCMVSSGAVYITSPLRPLCASSCYLWLIYATLHLALIVNVRGEMSLVAIVPVPDSYTVSQD